MTSGFDVFGDIDFVEVALLITYRFTIHTCARVLLDVGYPFRVLPMHVVIGKFCGDVVAHGHVIYGTRW